ASSRTRATAGVVSRSRVAASTRAASAGSRRSRSGSPASASVSRCRTGWSGSPATCKSPAWSAATRRSRSISPRRLATPIQKRRGGPPSESERERLEVPARQALGAAREEPREVHALDLLGHVLACEDAAAHHRADARCHQLPVRGDEGGVRDRQPERAAEERGHREPVRQPPHDSRLGDREDEAAPPAAPQGKRERRERTGAEEHAQGETPLAARAHNRYNGRDGRSSRLCLTSHTPRGVSRTAGRKSAHRKNSVNKGSWCGYPRATSAAR